MDEIKGSVPSSVKALDYDMKDPDYDKKVPEFDKKHLKMTGGHIGRNLVNITIKMSPKVRII